MPTFAPAFETSEHWRDGRVVDYSSLENYRAERHRGFESLSLRKEKTQSFGKQTVAFHIYSLHPVLHPLLGLSSNRFVHLSLKFITLGRSYLSKVALKHILEINEVHIANLFHIPADFTMQR